MASPARTDGMQGRITTCTYQMRITASRLVTKRWCVRVVTRLSAAWRRGMSLSRFACKHGDACILLAAVLEGALRGRVPTRAESLCLSVEIPRHQATSSRSVKIRLEHAPRRHGGGLCVRSQKRQHVPVSGPAKGMPAWQQRELPGWVQERDERGGMACRADGGRTLPSPADGTGHETVRCAWPQAHRRTCVQAASMDSYGQYPSVVSARYPLFRRGCVDPRLPRERMDKVGVFRTWHVLVEPCPLTQASRIRLMHFDALPFFVGVDFFPCGPRADRFVRQRHSSLWDTRARLGRERPSVSPPWCCWPSLSQQALQVRLRAGVSPRCFPVPWSHPGTA